jgi:hypothetical protein
VLGLVLRGGAGPNGDGLDDVFQAACEQLLRAEGPAASEGGGSTKGAEDGARARNRARISAEDVDMAETAGVIAPASIGFMAGAESVMQPAHHGVG